MKNIKIVLVLSFFSQMTFSLDAVQYICKNSVKSLVKRGCKVVVLKGKRAEIFRVKHKPSLRCQKSKAVAVLTDAKCSSNGRIQSENISNHLNDRNLSAFPKSRTH